MLQMKISNWSIGKSLAICTSCLSVLTTFNRSGIYICSHPIKKESGPKAVISFRPCIALLLLRVLLLLKIERHTRDITCFTSKSTLKYNRYSTLILVSRCLEPSSSSRAASKDKIIMMFISHHIKTDWAMTKNQWTPGKGSWCSYSPEATKGKVSTVVTDLWNIFTSGRAQSGGD